jgi:hypothetical protein
LKRSRSKFRRQQTAGIESICFLFPQELFP